MAEDPTRFLAAYDAVLDHWPVPVDRMDLASVYGTTRVIACGPVDGEPLVLLHGGGATSAVWFANVADLSRTRRVYAVDRIGEAGRSLRGGRPVRSVDDLLDWLDGVLDGVLDGGLDGSGPSRVDLCGHSYGGWIALTYALRTPQRVRKLALLDPTQCFAGYRAEYLLRALPLLIRATSRRARAFLAWETHGAEVDPAWLELYGLAAEFPRTKVVVGKRPTSRQLGELDDPDAGPACRGQQGARRSARRGGGAVAPAPCRDRGTPRPVAPRRPVHPGRLTQQQGPGLPRQALNPLWATGRDGQLGPHRLSRAVRAGEPAPEVREFGDEEQAPSVGPVGGRAVRGQDRDAFAACVGHFQAYDPVTSGEP